MDYSKVYTAEFSMRSFDVQSWSDDGPPMTVSSMSVSASATDSCSLLKTATVETDEPLETGWYKLYMTATQAGSVRVPLGVYLFSNRSTKYDRGIGASTASGYSPLKPAMSAKMPLGSYAPMGADGAMLAAKYISECIPVPVHVQGGFELSQHVVFPQGCSYLEAAWLMVDSAGWAMTVDGDGEVWVTPMPTEPALNLGRLEGYMLMPGVSEQVDDLVPNRYYAVQGSSVAVAENVSAGPTSYRQRGFWVDEIDTSPVRVNGETLQAYADRRLVESCIRTRRVSYEREFAPGVEPLSIVRCSIPEEGLDGDARVVSQKLDCSYGIKVSETIEFEENLWLS